MIRILFNSALAIAAVGLAGWSALAIWFAPLPRPAAIAALGAYGVAFLVTVLLVRPCRRALCCLFVPSVVVLAAWLLHQPSNERDWQSDVAILPYAEFDGDTVIVHNIRNCDYRSETNYVVHHYTKSFRVSDVQSLDLYLVNWGIPAASHAMMSFGFSSNEYLCVSIETRKQKGQDYSTLRGFFRNYELIYVVADERDVVRLRTNYRTGENVYLYRTKPVSLDVVRNIFLDYLRSINRLHEEPEWYNALTANCMVEAFRHATPYGPRAHWHWTVFLNGYFDRTMYESGAICTNRPFAETKAAALVNARAKAADKDPEFSKRIRGGCSP